MTDEERKDLDGKIQKIEEEKNLPVDKDSFQDATDKVLASFKPTYDNNKSMYENGKDVARTIGVRDALEDESFRDENKERAKKNIRIDSDTDQLKSEVERQEQLYRKLEPVLKFAKMMEPCDMRLMWITYGFTLVPYCLYMIIHGLFNLISGIFSGLNILFNSIFGTTEYLRDGDGKIVLDDKKRPIPSGTKVNLLTKILFGVIVGFVGLLILCGIIQVFTGFNLIDVIRKAVTGS